MKTDHTLAEPMRAYLLGLLSDDEATALEEAYFADRALFLKIQAEERVLIVDYLEERLRPEEKQAFASRYLKVPELNLKVEDVRRQRNALRPAAKPVGISVMTLRPLAMGAMLAMVLALGIGIWAAYHWQKKEAQSLAQVQPQQPAETAQPHVVPVPTEAQPQSHDNDVGVKKPHNFLPAQDQPNKTEQPDLSTPTINEPEKNVEQPQQVPEETPKTPMGAPGRPGRQPFHDSYVTTNTSHENYVPRNTPQDLPANASGNSAPTQNRTQAIDHNHLGTLTIETPGQTGEPQATSPSAAVRQPVLDQLTAQYPYVSGTNGCNVGNPDSALVMQQAGGGMRVLPVNSSVTIAKCTNRFVDGVLKPPGSACNGEAVGKVGGFLSHVPKVGGALGTGPSKVGNQAANQQLSIVKVGDTIYPTKLEVNEDRGEVKFSIVTCQESDYQQNPYKGEIVFQFPKDTLKPENVSKIEDTIAQVFAPGNGDRQSQDRHESQGTQQVQNASQQSSQAAACNIEIGQTIAQVESRCGKPVNQSKGAIKLIYFYAQPKLKVVFVDGKVSDIE